jgi:hypothetical protein
MPVEVAVRGLINGIRRDKFLIIPGWKTKLTYRMHRLTPNWLWNALTDRIVAKALRNFKKPPEAERSER